MFGKSDKSIKDRVSEMGSIEFGDLKMIKPRYEYTVKIFEEGGDGKPITSIQKGIKMNSDQELFAMYAMAQQKIQILEKREINPPQPGDIQPQPRPQMPPPGIPLVQQQAPQSQVAHQVKYFSGGGIDFKMVGDDLYQKQWVRATEDDCKNIRIINDANNKIVELKGKHIELLNWVKVETTDKA